MEIKDLSIVITTFKSENKIYSCLDTLPKKIRIDYLNEFAEQQSIVLEEFLATVFQHELDHLIGMLYVDRMEDVGTLMFEDEMDLLNEIGEDEILD